MYKNSLRRSIREVTTWCAGYFIGIWSNGFVTVQIDGVWTNQNQFMDYDFYVDQRSKLKLHKEAA